MDVKAIVDHLKTGDDVDAQLDDFNLLNENATELDLPVLVQTLRSDDAVFWVRELLAEPVLRIGGPQLLPEVLRAREKNSREGHDNDSLNALLADFAEETPLRS